MHTVRRAFPGTRRGVYGDRPVHAAAVSQVRQSADAAGRSAGTVVGGGVPEGLGEDGERTERISNIFIV